MTQKTIKTCAWLILMMLALVGMAHAQEQIPEQKRALIREILQITNTQINPNQFIDAILLQEEQSLPDRIARDLEENKELTPEEREKMRKNLTETAVRMSARLREVLPARINFAVEIENLIYPLYDKYFTESDLKEMIAFYQTPAGRKTLEVMPKMMLDAIKQIDQVLMPKMQKIVKEIIQEEEKRMARPATEETSKPK
jgi:hypothetical protein